MSSYPSIPRATYRLQFHQGFTFRDAQAVVPYLKNLGISHLYASPIFQAAPGSMHGYDIGNHNALNPELGTRQDFDDLLSCLRDHGLKIILDFVPNHMGIVEAGNLWWSGVLEDGPSSPYARFFDIDWTPLKQEMTNKILLPILGDQYGRVLERGELTLHYSLGEVSLHYAERRLPTALSSLAPLLKLAAVRLAPAVPTELESIIYALEHLPDNSEQDEVKIREKAREKEVIRTRLRRLGEEVPEVEKAIGEVLESLHQSEGGHDALDAFINAQSYRLASWKVASEEINYRRFFDVNDLAALRMDLPEVFDETHRLVLELLSSDVVAGLRIDHIDGLCDPRAYLEKLQSKYAALHQTAAHDRPLYLLVEKILGHDEQLRSDWPVHGTTGYEFAAQAMNVLVDPAAEEPLTRVYQQFSGVTASFPECVYRGKLLVMRTSMPSEVNMLAHMLHRLCQTNRWYRDFTLNALLTALREVIACFPVYRSYITPDGHTDTDDHRLILKAIASARRRNPDLERTVFEFIRDVLLPPQPNSHPVDEEARMAFVLRFQQCTGPITAKGVEDTAFYVYNRLVALNEVGGEPGQFGSSQAVFHKKNVMRQEVWPHSMLATSTHDTKRSEDVRARLAVLSELPQEWSRMLGRWQRINKKYVVNAAGSRAPDANEEYLIYQTLLGTWPLHPMSSQERAAYVSRVQPYMVKALHEAKVNSSWIEPNEEWDNAVREFVEKILTPARDNKFESSFLPFAEKVAAAGAVNSLAQVILKLTSPGVPDIYQGQEIWDFSLVDPDNRRPVDYGLRQSLLAPVFPAPGEMMQEWKNGQIKLHVTHRLLRLRQEHPDLFASGTYEPLEVKGAKAGHLIAFRRRFENRVLDVVVPCLTAAWNTLPLGDCWEDTAVVWGEAERTDVFTGDLYPARSGEGLAKTLFAEVPYAVTLGHNPL
ncbi:MAG TPA: malto-oligosyltrehalose synthase [Prosthecobacter sp.]